MLEVGVEVVDQQLLLQLLLNVYEEIRTLSWDALNLTVTLDLYHAYLYKRVCVYNFIALLHTGSLGKIVFF